MSAGIMVLGNARHGKDSVSNILRDDFGLSFVSSSEFVAEKAVRPWLAAKGVIYPDFATMYADRVNHRADWFDAIAAYNTPDLARLGRELFAVHDIYCGIRRKEELDALKAAGVVRVTFFVDASHRLPPEAATSMTVGAADADFVIDNNGPEKDLRGNVQRAYLAAVTAGAIPLSVDEAA